MRTVTLAYLTFLRGSSPFLGGRGPSNQLVCVPCVIALYFSSTASKEIPYKNNQPQHNTKNILYLLLVDDAFTTIFYLPLPLWCFHISHIHFLIFRSCLPYSNVGIKEILFRLVVYLVLVTCLKMSGCVFIEHELLK